MTRRHLESALIAGSLIENGLSSVFRLTKSKFQRTLYPPEYNDPIESKFVPPPLPEKPRCCKSDLLDVCPVESHDNSHKMIYEYDDFGVHSVKFSPDGRQLIAGFANTSVRVISVSDGRPPLVIRPSKWDLGMPVTCLRYIPPNLRWVVGCTPQGDVFCFDPTMEGFETIITEEKQQTYCLDVSPDGSEMATAGNDTEIRIYQLLDPSKIRSKELFTENGPMKLEEKSCKAERLTTECNKRPAAISSINRAFRLREAPEHPQPEVRAPQILGYHPAGPADNHTEGHSMRITALHYHPTQPRLLASASWDHYVKVWDTRTRKGPVHEIYGPLVCSPDGLDYEDNYILTASWRKRQALEVWDLRNLQFSAGSCRDWFGKGDVTDILNKHAYMKPAECMDVLTQVERDGHFENGVPLSTTTGEYLYVAKLLPSRAIVCGGSGFRDVRVLNRDTKLILVRIPTESVVQTLDTVLEGRFTAIGCANGSIVVAGLA